MAISAHDRTADRRAAAKGARADHRDHPAKKHLAAAQKHLDAAHKSFTKAEEKKGGRHANKVLIAERDGKKGPPLSESYSGG